MDANQPNAKATDLPEDDDPAMVAARAAGFTRTVLDHATNPRNVGDLPDPDGQGSVVGPCFDSMTMWLKVRQGRIAAATFWTDGCGPTIATGSITTELAIGKSVAEALQLRAEDVVAALGGLPDEHLHCAQLAVDTLHAALRDYLANQREPWRKLYQRR